jgi:hypothetical protein
MLVCCRHAAAAPPFRLHGLNTALCEGPPALQGTKLAVGGAPRRQTDSRQHTRYSERAQQQKPRTQALRPKLSEEQKEQLLECFDLMDADGSGAIDADEMGAAFKVV